MFSLFFIDRPKFAFVISIVLTLAGLIAIPILPVAEFPQISPPTVQVSTRYPGASAEVVRDTVAIPIEKEVNGVENMIYMSSKSANDGSYTLMVTFAIGSDPDLAQINVQNKVNLANPMLPEEVKRQGVKTEKVSTTMLMIINLYSPNRAYDGLFLSNYAGINVVDAIKRIPGVSDAKNMGAWDYGMRIWMNPDRMASLGITAQDISNAIREQNVQVPAGQVGAPPTPADTQFQYTLQTQGRLSTPEEFARIVLRSFEDGSIVYLGDVARIELGSQTYGVIGE